MLACRKRKEIKTKIFLLSFLIFIFESEKKGPKHESQLCEA